ncbi:MAG TPA: hypothetical protein VLM38_16915 [Blastocatellia bacterium]|nr:hypothetical protein [Blastocatellia bacterium]
MKRMIVWALSAFALLPLGAAPARMQADSKEPHTFLRRHFNFSKEDLDAIDRGKIVTKLPATSDRREVAALGVVRLNVSKEFFLKKFMDIESFKKSEIVSQIRRFNSPPRLEDLDELTLESEHATALKNCKVGNCNVRMPAQWIERFLKINWSAPDHKERATVLTRQLLLDYLRSYLKEGNGALAEYGDRPSPLRLADEIRSLINQSAHLFETAPDFHKYLSEFPRIQLADVEDFIYWSKERIGGFKPVLGLTHVTVYQQKTGSPPQIMIASKQIYANHYFEGSLALTWLVDAETEAGKTCSYLIYFNRSRMDALRGGFSWLKRYLARGKIRDGLAKNIRLTKQKLEGPEGQP